MLFPLVMLFPWPKKVVPSFDIIPELKLSFLQDSFLSSSESTESIAVIRRRHVCLM